MKDFNTSDTAVLVIDVQRGVFETKPPPRDEQSVLENINQITEAARTAGTLVIFLQHDGNPGEEWLVPFTEEWRLHPTLHVETDDRVIRKTACDGFHKSQCASHYLCWMYRS